MKTITKIIIPIMIIVGIIITFESCKKEEHKGYMTVKMTDAPANYLAVNVDVIGVSVNIENMGWIDLPTQIGIYNLLDLQNNIMVVLTDNVELPIGKVSQIRLKLGNDNSLITEDGEFALKVPSGEESGLKINVHTTILDSKLLEIVLDFDANESVIEEGNGDYSLKPVIKVKSIIQL